MSTVVVNGFWLGPEVARFCRGICVGSHGTFIIGRRLDSDMGVGHVRTTTLSLTTKNHKDTKIKSVEIAAEAILANYRLPDQSGKQGEGETLLQTFRRTLARFFLFSLVFFVALWFINIRCSRT